MTGAPDPTPTYVGVSIDSDAAWAWSDRFWFARHPEQPWRLRAPMAGVQDAFRETAAGAVWVAGVIQAVEALGEEWSITVIVRQITPGHRTRDLVAVPGRWT